MRLSTLSDYALRVLMHAALRRPELTTIDEVAAGYDISRNHLSKVVYLLSRQGFLATRRGVGGGFTLALDPNCIVIGDVIRVTERDDKVIDCSVRKDVPCAIFPVCGLKDVLAEAANAFFNVLDQYTLDNLVKRRPEMKDLLGI